MAPTEVALVAPIPSWSTTAGSKRAVRPATLGPAPRVDRGSQTLVRGRSCVVFFRLCPSWAEQEPILLWTDWSGWPKCSLNFPTEIARHAISADHPPLDP